MIWIRSFLFNFLFLVIWTPFVCLFFLPLLLISINTALWVGKTWACGSIFLARLICGIRYEIIGKEFIPDETCIIASKHQSAWDTMIFFTLFNDPCYVLKQELVNIPVLGLYLQRMQMIAVNRKDGSKALKKMTTLAAKRIKEGRNIVIFPEGTRSNIGASDPLQPGIAAIYNHSDIHVPVLPVALNSGVLWGRESFLKRPGTITLKFLPPIAPNLPRKEFMKRLEEQVHQESINLLPKAEKSE